MIVCVRLLHPVCSAFVRLDHTIAHLRQYSAMRCITPAFRVITPYTIYSSL